MEMIHEKTTKVYKSIYIFLLFLFFSSQGYEGSLLKVTSKNGKTASVSMINKSHFIYKPFTIRRS